MAESGVPLAEKMRQLELAYQMATEMSQWKEGFLVRVSHELRSPLNGIIGMHQLILADLCDSPEEEREFLTQAHDATLKMLQLLDNLLIIARIQHGTLKLKTQPLAIAEVLDGLYNLTFLAARDRNLRFQILPPDANVYLLADPLRLQQVLVNLVSRAIALMPEGHITLSAGLQPPLVHLWLDYQIAGDVPSEATDLISKSPVDSVRPSARLINHDLLPPPGLTWLTDQVLIEQMQGRLQVVTAPFRLMSRVEFFRENLGATYTTDSVIFDLV